MLFRGGGCAAFGRGPAQALVVGCVRIAVQLHDQLVCARRACQRVASACWQGLIDERDCADSRWNERLKLRPLQSVKDATRNIFGAAC